MYEKWKNKIWYKKPAAAETQHHTTTTAIILHLPDISDICD